MAEQMTSLERDTLSRKRIVSEMDKNFFVEAGAGSGKTTMLVKRMVAMVESGIDIRKICAITFTRAAAGEFYDRFQKLLIERSSPDTIWAQDDRPGSLPCPTAETRKRCSEALQNIDLCFMGTIDAFCGMVLSEHPTEAKIPSDASLVSDEDAAAIYRQEYVRISSGEYGEELRTLAKAFQAVNRNPQEVFVNGMSFLMNNRNVHFNFHESGNVDIDKAFEHERAEIVRAAKCLTEHPELAYEGNRESRDAWDRITDSYHAVRRRWSSNYNNVLFALKSLKKIRVIPEAVEHHAVALGALFTPGGKGKKPKWMETSFGEEGGLIERLNKLQYEASMTFLVRSIPVLENVMQSRGSLTYFDYLYYLRNMLKSDAQKDGKLIRYIYDRHSCFLIDEFQDTNPLQAEVFFYLASEHPAEQWSACVPRKGSLFIVGDPKQSIYRFRSADVASFLKVKKLFESGNGEILTLSRNFRSTKMLCEYYNRVFSVLLPQETPGQSKYEEIPLPDPVDDEFQGVFIYSSYTGNKAAEEFPARMDPVRIGDIIERLVNREDYRIRTEGDKNPRRIRYSDIMVITSNKRSLAPITDELKEREIPTRVEGDVPFTKNEALKEISLVFSALADADDTPALFGVLTGTLFALTREDLMKYKAAGGRISIKAAGDMTSEDDSDTPSDPSVQYTSETMDWLRDLYLQSRNLSPAALFSKIMDEFRIYQCVSAENMEAVYYAQELLRGAEKAGEIISLKDGAAYLRNLTEGGSEEERCLNLNAEKDCVHLANLHKVKGLEAPVVILAGASNIKHTASYRMEHGDAGSEGYLFSLSDKSNENSWSASCFQTSDYADEKAAEEDALDEEDRRLVYVAATRARNVLILCNSSSIRWGKEVPDSRWSPIMESGLPDFFESVPEPVKEQEDTVSYADAEELYEKAEEKSSLNERTVEEASFHVENPSRLRVKSKLAEDPDQEEREAPEDPDQEEGGAPEKAESREANPASADSEHDADIPSGDGRRFAALLGTMTHKLMETLVTSWNQCDPGQAIEEIIREYRTPWSEAYENQFRDALLKVAQTMRNGGYPQTNGLPQDLLGTLLSAEEVYCEVPFCYLVETDDNEKTVWDGVIDVIYRAAGRWHIIDYKTNSDGNDLDAKYQEQLGAYISAFKKTTGMDADALTYHIDI